MGMWHVTQKPILLLGLFLKGITRCGGGQESVHKVCGWSKSLLPVGSYLVWEGDLQGLIAGAGIRGLARCMPPMID